MADWAAIRPETAGRALSREAVLAFPARALSKEDDVVLEATGSTAVAVGAVKTLQSF